MVRMSEESQFQRDQRLRGEEARLTRMEDALSAIRELLTQVRDEARRDKEDLRGHMAEDIRTFQSLDSRLQGIQTQLTQIQLTGNRIENEVNTLKEVDIKTLRTDVNALQQEHRDGILKGRWWKEWWALVLGGMTAGGIIVGIAANLIGLFS